jgi:Uma2 family endonuclease
VPMAIRQPRPTKSEFPVSKYHGRRMSEAEYLALPEEKPYLEYVDGVVLQKPMPNEDHLLITGELIIEIGLYARSRGGKVGPEGRFRLADGTGHRLPDASYWAAGRPIRGFPPSLAIEVLSPNQTASAARAKCRAFRRNGVDVCWLIDPAARTVEVFEQGREGLRLDSGEPLETSLMLGFSLSQAELFSVLDS